jgi:predicted N-acyltransferase
MGPSVRAIVGDIHDLDRAAWDRVAGENLFLRHEWLTSIARPDGTTAYALVLEDEQPAGALVVHLIPEPSFVLHDPVGLLLDLDHRMQDHPYQSEDERDRYSTIAAGAAPEDAYPAAVCLAAVGLTPGVATATGGSARVADHLVEVFESIADRWSAAMRAFLYLDPTVDARMSAALERGGYLGAGIDVRAVLPLPAADFGGYLRALKRTRRRPVRREVKAFRERGLDTVLLSAPTIRSVAPELAHLAAHVQEKHGNAFDPAGSLRTLSFLTERCPEFVEAIVAQKDGRPVAFHLFYSDDHALYSAFTGQDYSELSREAFAQFNVFFYEAIRLAAERNLQRIDYGLGIGPDHLHRGGIAVGLTGYFRAPAMADGTIGELLALLDRTQRRRLEQAAAHRPYLPAAEVPGEYATRPWGSPSSSA